MTDVTFSLNGLNLDLDDGTGDKLKVVEMEGWWDGTDSTGSVYQHPFADWGWIDPAFSMSKRIVIRGTAKASSRVRLRALLRRLVQSVPFSDLGPLVGYEDGETKYIRVRQDEVRPRVTWLSDVVATWDMQLVAPDGRFLAGDGTGGATYSQSVMLPSVTGGLQVLGLQGTITNLVPNPSFEVDLTGWTFAGGAGTRSNAFPMVGKVGSYNLQVTSNATVNIVSAKTAALPVTAGDWIGLRAFLASEITSTNAQVQLYVEFLDGGAAVVGSAQTTWVTAQFYNGIIANLTAQVTAGAVSAVLYARLRNGNDTVNPVTNGWRLWADAFLLVTDTTQAAAQAKIDRGYFDGSVVTAGVGTFAWTGTAHNSTSTYTGPWSGLQTPFQINATVISNNLTVHTVGDATPPMTFSILGPVVNPTVRTDDGQVMKFMTTLDTGQTLLVDLDRKTVTLNGVNRRNVLVGDWIVPNNGTVLYFDADFYNSTAQLTVAWSDAWS